MAAENPKVKIQNPNKIPITKIQIIYVVLAICYVLSAICYAQSAKEIKRGREKIAKQGIKTRTETNYYFKEESGEYKRVINVKGVTKYDDKGNVIEWDYSCSTDSNIFNKRIFIYDDKGNKTKVMDMPTPLSQKAPDPEITFKYDDKGNIIEETCHLFTGKSYIMSAYKYDDKGNKIGLDRYDHDGKLEMKSILKYDKNENVIEEIDYVVQGSKEIPQSQTVYEYTFYDQSKEKR